MGHGKGNSEKIGKSLVTLQSEGYPRAGRNHGNEVGWENFVPAATRARTQARPKYHGAGTSGSVSDDALTTARYVARPLAGFFYLNNQADFLFDLF